MSVPMAEFVGAWPSLKSGVQLLNCDQVFLEVDSTTIISWIHYPLSKSADHPLLFDIVQWSRVITVFSATHFCCEANKVADWLAKTAWDHDSDVEPLHPMPMDLNLLVQVDVEGVTYR